MFSIQKAMEAVELRKGIADVSYIDEMIDSLRKNLVNQIKTNLDYGFDLDNDREVIENLKKELDLMEKQKEELDWEDRISMERKIERRKNAITNQETNIEKTSMVIKSSGHFINYYQDMIESFVSLRDRILSSNQ